MRLPLALLCLSLAACPRGAPPEARAAPGEAPMTPAEIARGYLSYDAEREARRVPAVRLAAPNEGAGPRRPRRAGW
jgi:hypothetical protein